MRHSGQRLGPAVPFPCWLGLLNLEAGILGPNISFKVVKSVRTRVPQWARGSRTSWEGQWGKQLAGAPPQDALHGLTALGQGAGRQCAVRLSVGTGFAILLWPCVLNHKGSSTALS